MRQMRDASMLSCLVGRSGRVGTSCREVRYLYRGRLKERTRHCQLSGIWQRFWLVLQRSPSHWFKLRASRWRKQRLALSRELVERAKGQTTEVRGQKSEN